MSAKWFLITAMATAIGAASSAGYTWQADPPPQPERKVGYAKGRSLIAELKQTDKVLEVQLTSSGPTPAPRPDGMSRAEYLTRYADLVALVHIEQKAGQLTPEEDWINTTVSARITRLLKNQTSVPLIDGHILSFEMYGGEIEHEGRKIVASQSWVQPIDLNKTYLIFAKDTPRGLVVGGADAYEVDGKKVRDLHKQRRPEDSISNTDVDRVVTEVQSKAHLSRIR